MTAMLCGFPPIAPRKAQVLILGSMPGVESLKQQQYYAHPRNLFWPIMDKLVGIPVALPYHARTQRLAQAGIALWDVLKACERQGSLDSAITPSSVQVNDFSSFFSAHRQIKAVFLNGRKAYDLFQRHVHSKMIETLSTCQIMVLPSTSPAFAGMKQEDKLKRWAVITPYLTE